MSQVDTTNSEFSILYLEDEILIAIDVTSLLRDSGFKLVKTVHRLKSAWDAAASTQFDIALLDINVDGKQTSIELGEKLKSEGVHVVFASGNGADACQLEERGFHFIDKPFTHEALSEQIANVLRQTA